MTVSQPHPSEEQNIFDLFLSHAIAGWRFSESGNVGGALEEYRAADDLLPTGKFSPELSVLRHNVGKASGEIISIPPTEDKIFTLLIPDTAIESESNIGMTPPLIDTATLEESIRQYIDIFEPGFHTQNIEKDLPHVQVLSTGRCGTVSLYHLLSHRRLNVYHTFWWSLSPTIRWEMQCRMLSGNIGGDGTGLVWAATRAAEWLGAISSGIPMVDLNHKDMIFAPVFASIHPRSKFIHLKRNPIMVFDSFYSKNQWRGAQLRPMDFSFTAYFNFHLPEDNLPADLAWYVYFTDQFSKALGRVVGPERFIEVNSEKLFRQDRDEISKLIWFTGSNVDQEKAVEHFCVPINKKAHKVEVSDDDMIDPRVFFIRELARLYYANKTHI